MNYRDFFQKIIYYIINPLIKAMIKSGITPNMVTTIGCLLNIVAAAMFYYAGCSYEHAYDLLGCGGGLLLFAGVFDMMDGRLARMGNMSTTFGAMWDSVLDRYSELLSLFGIACYFSLYNDSTAFVVTFLAMVGSIMVSYVRARAEGLDIECKVGLLQRPERVVLTAVGAIFASIFAEPFILFAAMVIIAVLANITAFWRVAHCYRQLKKRD